MDIQRLKILARSCNISLGDYIARITRGLK